ncbi:pyridoxal phosphate-dependent transferase [Suillus bovinus]|uniref:pyridoxal phosphate-dependent transferase n=1 Tax=Suillus bovinus TaxID=48563 RepID=UPI001B85C40D|nr:pyridoxal phosphate-dependent transferase [Suillus bovinus]KAG2158346.1 pyridoxal phosphate-dependent transferase [Suillus bovinus]
MESRAINFGAGPSALPTSVLQEATKGLLNFKGTASEFTAYLQSVEQNIRKLLDVQPTHSILFTQGGGTTQFSAVVLNMLARHRLLHPQLKDEDRVLDYVVTGSWSKKAAEEARRMGGSTVNIAADSRKYSKDQKSFDNIPTADAYSFSNDPALIYYCANETVDGVEFSAEENSPASFPFQLLPKNALLPLVGDYSSSFMSRPIPHLSDHAIIYAGAQKNVGPAGLTILIVRNDCIVDVDAATRLGATSVPICLSYKTLADHNSLFNTPPVLSIYITGLVLEYMLQLGGLDYYADLTNRKSRKVYDALKDGENKGIFKSKVKEGSGSQMNVVFDVLGEGLLAKFVAGAEERGMKGLKGHRSVGGIRVSIYNAVTEEETDQLISYMEQFAGQHEVIKE